MLHLFKKKILPPPLPVNEKKIIPSPSMYTPDYHILEQYQKCLLFVADEWMKDRRQNFVIDQEHSIRRGNAFTFGKFSYRTYEGMAYAPDYVTVALKTKDFGYPIMGEVIEISPDAFLRLDKLRKNTVQCLRQRTILAMPYRDGPIVFENTIAERAPHVSITGGIDWLTGKFPDGHPLAGKKYWLGPEKIAYIRAWMYVGLESYWKSFQNMPFAFRQVPTFKPKKSKWWLTEYYKYQNPTE